MRVSIIVAMDEDNGIGRQGSLPWHLPSDLKRFKSLTMGHHVIMGRKTYESIGRPLAGRSMLVVTRQKNYYAPGCEVAPSLEAGIETAKTAGENELFVIGGAQLYQQALAVSNRLYLTRVHSRVEADVKFPQWDPLLWKLVETLEQAADEKHEFPYTFYVLDRV